MVVPLAKAKKKVGTVGQWKAFEKKEIQKEKPKKVKLVEGPKWEAKQVKTVEEIKKGIDETLVKPIIARIRHAFGSLFQAEDIEKAPFTYKPLSLDLKVIGEPK